MNIGRIQEKLLALEKLAIHRTIEVHSKGLYLRSAGVTSIKYTSLAEVGNRLDELLLREIRKREDLEGFLD